MAAMTKGNCIQATVVCSIAAMVIQNSPQKPVSGQFLRPQNHEILIPSTLKLAAHVEQKSVKTRDPTCIAPSALQALTR
jgi:hypothetical protein